MIFEIHAERNSKDKRIFYYNNETNELKDELGNEYKYPTQKDFSDKNIVIPFDKNTPLKKTKYVKHVKIQMGLSCNYSCDYCSQKFVERPKETTAKDIENFMEMFNKLEFSEEKGLRIEFWGGEPFVYWKTMKPLAETLKDKFKDWKKQPEFTVITNGSILTEDICAWLYAMDFSVAISHDGPGQFVRGPDPFEDPKKKETVLDFYNVMRPLNKISFNSMLNSKNLSRKAIYDYFVEFTGDENVVLGEGGFVDAYDEDGLENSLSTKKQRFEFRRQALGELLYNEGKIGFMGIVLKINSFIDDVLNRKPAKILGQKCGMDEEDIVAFDMKGNVITCQNVSAVEMGHNGQSHHGGNITNIDDVEIKTATHWANRKECSGCPVLHVCRGSCMFLDGKYWESSCNNAFSDAIPIFATGFEKITEGYIPTLINNKELPLDRQDIWGTIYEHKEETPKRKTIPIKLITDRKTVLDGIEVYEKSIVIEEK